MGEHDADPFLEEHGLSDEDLAEHARDEAEGVLLADVIDLVDRLERERGQWPPIATVCAKSKYHTWLVCDVIEEAQALGLIRLDQSGTFSRVVLL